MKKESIRNKISLSLKKLWERPEHRKKMSLSHTGKTGENSSNWKGGKKKKNCLSCEKEFLVFKGRENSAKFCSKRCVAKGKVGIDSRHWKGGITKISHKGRTSLDYKFWRKNCLIKDNFTCKKCLVSGNDLIVHHINNFKDFPELRTEISNGIILCRKCHIMFHKKYTQKNNTLEQIQEFLTIA